MFNWVICIPVIPLIFWGTLTKSLKNLKSPTKSMKNLEPPAYKCKICGLLLVEITMFSVQIKE